MNRRMKVVNAGIKRVLEVVLDWKLEMAGFVGRG